MSAIRNGSVIEARDGRQVVPDGANENLDEGNGTTALPGQSNIMTPESAGDDTHEFLIEELYRHHSRALVDFAASLQGDAQGAHDVVHDVFMRVIRSQPDWIRSDNARAFLFVAIRNRTVDLIRRFRRLEVLDPSELDEIPCDAEVKLRDEGEYLRDWIKQRLGSKYCRVVLMQLDGMELCEIAHRLRLPIGTVKRRLHAARTKMRSNWNRTNPLEC